MRVRSFVIVLLLIVANVEAFSAGAMGGYLVYRGLTRRRRKTGDNRNPVSEVSTALATPTATPIEQSPEVKAPAGETTVLIGLGFLFLATFRMMIVGF
jgi:hypothetical protein